MKKTFTSFVVFLFVLSVAVILINKVEARETAEPKGKAEQKVYGSVSDLSEKNSQKTLDQIKANSDKMISILQEIRDLLKEQNKNAKLSNATR